VPAETAGDARAGGDGLDAGPVEVVLDPARSPPRMLAPELADPGLELRGDLVGTAGRSMGTGGQGPQTARFVEVPMGWCSFVFDLRHFCGMQGKLDPSGRTGRYCQGGSLGSARSSGNDSCSPSIHWDTGAPSGTANPY
jgi:hypothetical protein